MSPKSPFFSLASVNELALDPWFSALFLVMLTIITEAEYKLNEHLLLKLVFSLQEICN